MYGPTDSHPQLSILIDNQGETHDGGIFDDPTDDTEWEKVKFAWSDVIRTGDGCRGLVFSPRTMF